MWITIHPRKASSLYVDLFMGSFHLMFIKIQDRFVSSQVRISVLEGVLNLREMEDPSRCSRENAWSSAVSGYAEVTQLISRWLDRLANKQDSFSLEHRMVFISLNSDPLPTQKFWLERNEIYLESWWNMRWKNPIKRSTYKEEAFRGWMVIHIDSPLNWLRWRNRSLGRNLSNDVNLWFFSNSQISSILKLEF